MTGRIYLLNGSSELTAMEEAPYDSERLLQELLATHPGLLAGEQIDTKTPRRWLLVTREMLIPGEVNGAGRWSLDHLFLDQDGVPTLVEVKRSSDTRIRREVVGQMLDYAANAVAYWPVEGIQATFESRCKSQKLDPTMELSVFLMGVAEPDNFWQRVKTNLQAGRIRLVFVADEIPSELRRIVEFLNSHMDPTEVLAVEIKQFIGGGMKTLVPRVLGLTESAGRKRVAGTFRDTVTDSEFLNDLGAARPADESRIAREIIEWSHKKGLVDEFKKGQRGSDFVPLLRIADMDYNPFSVQSRGMLVIPLRWLRSQPPFNEESRRNDLLTRLQQLPGLRASDASKDGFPMIPLAQLADIEVFAKTLEILDWIVTEISSTIISTEC